MLKLFSNKEADKLRRQLAHTPNPFPLGAAPAMGEWVPNLDGKLSQDQYVEIVAVLGRRLPYKIDNLAYSLTAAGINPIIVRTRNGNGWALAVSTEYLHAAIQVMAEHMRMNATAGNLGQGSTEWGF